MLLLDINKNPYMGSQVAVLNLTFSDLEMSKSRSLRFQSLLSFKGALLGHMLLLNINRKPEPYMGSPMALLNLTLSDLRFFMVGDLYGVHLFASSLLPP